MSSLGTSKGILEIAKFGLYVSVPIFLMYTFANNTKNLQKVMGNSANGEEITIKMDTAFCLLNDFLFAQPGVFRPYVVYPPEGPRPPSPEELREMARELARKNNIR